MKDRRRVVGSLEIDSRRRPVCTRETAARWLREMFIFCRAVLGGEDKNI
jgi:hypothetical protein